METIYDILSKEHQIVLGMFEEAMDTGSKAALFRIKAEIDPHMAGDEKFSTRGLKKKKNQLILPAKHILSITKLEP
jgi:hypothetical protein